MKRHHINFSRSLMFLFMAMAVLFFACVRSARAAEVIPSIPKYHFNDYAGVISPGVVVELDDELATFEKNTSTQVVVAIYPKMQSDSDIDDYGVRVAQAWHVGTKGKDNGVVMLVFTQDHKITIKTGYGLEGALPDATCKSIIDEQIAVPFKNGNYDAGMRNGVQSILLAVQGEYQPAPAVVPKASVWNWLPSCLCLISVPLFLIFISFLPKPKGYVYSGSGRSSGMWSAVGLLASVAMSSGGGSGGGGGGFSSGGGSFGGGGASGSW